MDRLLELIKRFEGCHKRLPDGSITTYRCPAGVVTIGWGTTGIPEGTVWTQAQCDAELLRKANECMIQSAKASPVLLRHPIKHQAIADFVYNLGIGRYKASTLKRRVDAEDWDGAVIELRKWVFGGGKRLPGLVARREAEAELFSIVQDEPEKTNDGAKQHQPAGHKVGVGHKSNSVCISRLSPLMSMSGWRKESNSK